MTLPQLRSVTEFYAVVSVINMLAWVFPFMFLVFHLPHAVSGSFSRRVEARCLGSLMLFWIIEDFLWFVLNPCFGLAKFAPQFIPWHKKWLLGLPTDYLLFSTIGILLITVSFRRSD